MRSIATKRKTTTSSEVKTRWNAKTYKSYGVRFRKDTQADLIEKVESLKRKGLKTSEIFAAGIESLKIEGDK